MSRAIFSVMLVAISMRIPAYAEGPMKGKGGAQVFTLDAVDDAAAAQTAAQPFSLVLAWLARNAPECPPAAAPEVAAKFVEQLSLLYPGETAQSDAALQRFEPLLWQTLAVCLHGSAYDNQRQLFALRRVRALAQRTTAGPERAEAAVTRLKKESPAAYRRLAEGRMEDEEIARLPGLAPERDQARSAAAAAAPKVLSAQEIAGEFARRNQVGAAAARLQSYRMEARLRNPDGSEQVVHLFKLRPDRFRMDLWSGRGEAVTVAFDGTRYWRQIGTKVEPVDPAALGSLQHANEFLDPLFGAEGVQFTRLEDQVIGGRKCHALRVQRRDGSAYVAFLDQENYHELGRDNPDGTRIRYSDFRDLAGVTVAYHEAILRPGGQSASVEIRQATANADLIGIFFQTPAADRFDLAPLERMLDGAANP